MNDWAQELALAEAAAERIEAQEQTAERSFDQVFDKAEAAGTPETALQSKEFAGWMEARKETDAAWGRWSIVMAAKPLA